MHVVLHVYPVTRDLQQALANVKTAELNLADAQAAQQDAADATAPSAQFADHALTAARVQLSADQAKLATAANVSQSLISSIERGIATTPENLVAIREALARYKVTVITDRKAANYGALGG